MISKQAAVNYFAAYVREKRIEFMKCGGSREYVEGFNRMADYILDGLDLGPAFFDLALKKRKADRHG